MKSWLPALENVSAVFSIQNLWVDWFLLSSESSIK